MDEENIESWLQMSKNARFYSCANSKIICNHVMLKTDKLTSISNHHKKKLSVNLFRWEILVIHLHAFSFHCIKIRQLIKQWNEWKKEQKKCKLCIYAIYSNNNIASIRIWIESMNIIKWVSDAVSFSDRQTDKKKET